MCSEIGDFKPLFDTFEREGKFHPGTLAKNCIPFFS